jgi:hypothetical protein
MAMTYDDRTVQKIEAGGSIAEAGGGIAIIVLAIIALAGAAVGAALTSVAVIVLGASFLVEGGAVASEFARLLGAQRTGEVRLGGGVTAEMAGGATILVLGILALLGIHATVLVPAAVIVGGALLLLTAGTLLEITHLRAHLSGGTEGGTRVVSTGVSGEAGMQFLAGAAAIVLGIIAFSPSMGPMALSAVALLVLGGALAINATAMTTSLMGVFSH